MVLKLYCDRCEKEVDLGLLESGSQTIQYLKRNTQEKEAETKTYCHLCFSDILGQLKEKKK